MKRALLGVLIAAAAMVTAWFFLSFWIGFFSPSAHAYPYVDCRTDYMSNSSYTYCGWQDAAGVWHRTVTTCLGGSNHCTTREAG